MLGLGEWREREELRKELLPHDEIETTKDFFTLTPLGCRFINSAHRKKYLRHMIKHELKKMLKRLHELKNWRQCEFI